MASIDKTYTNSYAEYISLVEWANGKTVTFFDGLKKEIPPYIRKYNESDFNGNHLPIMNTPTWMDIYLIQNCKIQFVIDRMKEVYSAKTIFEYYNVDLSAPPPSEYKQNRKIVIKRNTQSKFKIHSKPYSFRNRKVLWNVTSIFWYFQYNSKSKKWINTELCHYPTTTNMAHYTSIKAIIRALRKQYLPSGITFHMSGRYIGEDYTIYVR